MHRSAPQNIFESAVMCGIEVGRRNGTRLQLWDCNDTAAQAWHLP